MENTYFLFNLRITLALSTEEAGQLVGVTKRSWELWESGKNAIPSSRLELLKHKLEGLRSEERELIVVVSDCGQRPIDVIADDTFLSLKRENESSESYYIISSLAIDQLTKRPYVKRQKFHTQVNQHAINKARNWINS